MLLEDRDRECFFVGATKKPLACKVKEERVVVVELIQSNTLWSSDQSLSGVREEEILT